MNLFSDIGTFLKSLTFVDVVFFFAVILLLILIIVLIYFIKINDHVFEEKQNKVPPKEIVIENKPIIESKTDYEKDQEDKAIISYDELIKKGNYNQINYEDEKRNDDLEIKKINLENTNNFNVDEIKTEVRVISYQKEEEFLKALKVLQASL